MTTSLWLSLTDLGRIFGISAVHCGRLLSDAGLRQQIQGLCLGGGPHQPMAQLGGTGSNVSACTIVLRREPCTVGYEL
jgi:hypothetical protein